MSHSEEYDARIIAGAAELFRTCGIKAVTMDEIANHLGISKRTIYERFGDKDELLFAVMDAMIIKQREKIADILNSSPDVIAAIFTLLNIGKDHAASMNPLIGSDLRKYHNNVLLRIKEKCENPDYEGSLKVLEKGKEQGIFRQDIDNEIVSRFFSGLSSMITDSKVFPSDEFLHRDLIKNVIINYLRGISTSKGNKIIDKMEPGL
jgi:AcrR family transcriptional regulator